MPGKVFVFKSRVRSGSRVGAVVRALAHQCGPGSIPGLDVICGLSLLFVLFSAAIIIRYSGNYGTRNSRPEKLGAFEKRTPNSELKN